MIEVEALTRRYGDFTAIQNVSFSVKRGEVVGFLGPNGAGKSTTMRILSGCIGATAGHARIGGVDVLQKPNEVKRRIGYLPEVPPLYGAMVVEDYVAFAASIKGVAKPAMAASQALERVGLGDVRDRVIDHLSKGFRQRVGLAQALVHEPEVLVLDEPTSGLDPAQRREIRNLLHELAAGERTVILSTHVLAEVEAVCERVVIINRGQIVSTARIDDLAARRHGVRLRVAQLEPGLIAQLESIEGVCGVNRTSTGALEVQADREVRAAVARVAVHAELLELSPMNSLEDAYLELTGSGGSEPAGLDASEPEEDAP
ncbi:MAG: MFS transporter [Deltaproteobacteria bacterium]|nr:MFS transporter [Deltaproteobacteria bacterium]HCH65853.1 MFS transporter [Deltaproteobacteria bacterium]